jgi:hypothetical protein
MAGLVSFKARRANARGKGNEIRFRDGLAAWSRSVGRAALALCLLVLIAYLSLAPAFLTTAENEYQTAMKAARQPGAYWSALEAEVQQIRADEQVMQRLKAVVALEMAAARAREDLSVSRAVPPAPPGN